MRTPQDILENMEEEIEKLEKQNEKMRELLSEISIKCKDYVCVNCSAYECCAYCGTLEELASDINNTIESFSKLEGEE